MINLNRCRVLVTGAGGFIGSHLAERLVEEAAHLRVLVHYNSRNSWGHLETLPLEKKRHIEVIMGDVADAGLVHSCLKRCDVAFHLAALIGIPFSYHAPELYIKTNIIGTHNVLRAALDAGISKIVQTSTSEVYGTAQYIPIDEGHPLRGQSPYSASKIGADKIAESYHLSFKLPVAILRPFNTYGPRQSARAVIPAIITQLLHGPRLKLGAVTPVRDLTYVDDTVEAFIAIARARKSEGEVINAGSGTGISISDLASRIGRLMGIDKVSIALEKKRVRPESSEVYRLICDNRKAKRLMNWKPRVSIDEGLARTIDYIRAGSYHHRDMTYTV